VADPSHANPDPATLAHRVIDQLTATKLRVASLRLHLRQERIALEAIEESLAHIEQEIDTTAALAQDLRGQVSEAR
jgi:hypothetical protein